MYYYFTLNDRASHKKKIKHTYISVRDDILAMMEFNKEEIQICLELIQ